MRPDGLPITIGESVNPVNLDPMPLSLSKTEDLHAGKATARQRDERIGEARSLLNLISEVPRRSGCRRLPSGPTENLIVPLGGISRMQGKPLILPDFIVDSFVR